MSEIYNQFRGSGNDKKIKVAVEGIKLTTDFWKYRPKRLLFELASRKNRTVGVDQKFLILGKPRLAFWSSAFFISFLINLLISSKKTPVFGLGCHVHNFDEDLTGCSWFLPAGSETI
jgi:hypothetical protein